MVADGGCVASPGEKVHRLSTGVKPGQLFAYRVAGLPFPYWEDHFNWRAAGARDDRIAGRFMTTVLYRRAGWLPANQGAASGASD